jgi:coenzyme F420-reducing hydrogenase beta subunit
MIERAKMTSEPNGGKPTVVTEVTAHGLCIGCGACVAVCPSSELTMKWTDGAPVASDRGDPCDKACGLCLSVCPFADGNPDEDAIAREAFDPELPHTRETGFYRECICGHWPERRLESASGGFATWYLADLLADGAVDHVLCVGPNAGRPLFSYTVASTPEQVLSAAKSAYYPVEMSDVLLHVRKNEGRYAVIALPCFAKAIRLACAAVPVLGRRITHVAGLVCGHGCTEHFAAYCARAAGLSGPIRSICFRSKCQDGPAQNYAIDVELDGGETGRVRNSGRPGNAFAQWWFSLSPCLFCDDLFAECADVAFMDAWLPEYSRDPRGTSLAILRSPDAVERFRRAREAGDLSVSPIDVGDVIWSQRHGYDKKVRGMPYRIELARRRGQKVPSKREPVGPPLGRLDRMLQRSLLRMCSVGQRAWSECGGDLEAFHRRVKGPALTRFRDRVVHALLKRMR